MPISQALYTGVTGMSVMADGMTVVANNIANANAKGFKKDRVEFEDMLSADRSTGSGTGQLGRGALLRSIRTIHTQGGLSVTDNLTDLAIQGEGFFVVKNPSSDSSDSAANFYTRVGSFVFDKDGYLAEPAGGRVMGYMAKSDGSLGSRLEEIRIDTNAIPPRKTDKVTLDLNLDARIKPSDVEFDVNNPEATSQFNHTITVFDSHGRGHAMSVFYNRVETSEGMEWKWRACFPSKDVEGASLDQELVVGPTGSIKFDSKGNLIEETNDGVTVNFGDGAEAEQVIEFDFGKNVGEEKGNGTNATRCISAKSVTNYHSQNGYETGNIKNLKIELDGTIRGLFTNGVQRTLGALAMASFENIDGLSKAGGNKFYETRDSGPAKLGMALSGLRGSIVSSTLEESNVDLAQEFVNMIMTQRGFQANSRSITTADSMIEEVVNLRR
jgi:flagellar hook protein FlgE